MDNEPKIPQKNYHSKAYSLLLICLLVLATVVLPYSIIKNLIDRSTKNYEYTNQALSLPKLEPANPTERDPPKATPPKIPVQKARDGQWQNIHPRPGDSMALIFSRLGLSAKNLHAVLYKNPYAKVLTTIKPSQQLQFLITKNQLEKLIVPVDAVQTLTIYKMGELYKTKMDSKKTVKQNLYITGTLRAPLSVTAKQLNMPYKLVRQMTDLLNKQVEVSRTPRIGDHFSIVYDADYLEDKMVGTGDIQALRYSSRGKTFEVIRHTDAHGTPDYYTAKGNSLKKAFSRYPFKFSHITSTFTRSRMHPILRYRRAHKGIDLAAPIGTPIKSIGDGVITSIGRRNGYGNMIQIKHDKTYTTIYAHMLRFQRGLYRGSKIRRDQVIGYVGQTGLATGPHCHFELHVNNQPRNPTTIPLPTAAPITGRQLVAFKAKTNMLLARLKLYEQASIASSGKKNAQLG
jgi:murein DD-endopeptidase MepM/ murein hydrolase activator NlpD